MFSYCYFLVVWSMLHKIDALPCNLQQLYYDDGTEEYRSCEMICDPLYEDIDLVLCNTVCAEFYNCMLSTLQQAAQTTHTTTPPSRVTSTASRVTSTSSRVASTTQFRRTEAATDPKGEDSSSCRSWLIGFIMMCALQFVTTVVALALTLLYIQQRIRTTLVSDLIPAATLNHVHNSGEWNLFLSRKAVGVEAENLVTEGTASL